MQDLYELTMAQATESVIEEIMEACNVNKKMAMVILKNTLLYNCVIEEIVSQAEFLTGHDEWRY